MRKQPRRASAWLYDVLLILVLAVGAYLRLVGLNWDENQHLHPDERFLTMVESALQARLCRQPGTPLETCPAEQKRWLSLAEYFDTASSPLNPHNRGYGFFVYGTLPIFIVRYSAEIATDLSLWAATQSAAFAPDHPIGRLLAELARTPNWTGYDQVNLIGRQWSALADLGTIVLLYLIASRLYGRKVGLLAAAFSSLAVLQIQQSHFFTVDTFANFFIFLAIYVAVEVAEIREAGVEGHESGAGITGGDARFSSFVFRFLNDPLLLLSAGFGVALGMAVASKLNAAPLAVLLPAAFFVRASREAQSHTQAKTDYWSLLTEHFFSGRVLIYLAVGAIVAGLAFRIFQPYAFSGIGLNPAWLSNIREQRAQASGDVDVPFALQWARRSHLFSFQNLTLWGLGLPLGILAWAGFLWMGWRMLKGDALSLPKGDALSLPKGDALSLPKGDALSLPKGDALSWQVELVETLSKGDALSLSKGEWRPHAMLWGWTAAYFLWQSLQFNPTMRYQLPIYPLLAMMAAWAIVRLWENGRRRWTMDDRRRTMVYTLSSLFAVFLGLAALIATAAWVFAFTRIYTRDHPRLAATRWIYQNVPGPINLRIQTPEGESLQQPLPFPYSAVVRPETPLDMAFTASADGALTEISLHDVGQSRATPKTLQLRLSSSSEGGEQMLAQSTLSAAFAAQGSQPGAYVFSLPTPFALQAGQTYALIIQLADETQGEIDLCAPIHLQLSGGPVEQVIAPATACIVAPDQPLQTTFIAQAEGNLMSVALTRAEEILPPPRAQTLSLLLSEGPAAPPEQILARAALTSTFNASSGDGYVARLDHPVSLVKGRTYFLRLESSGPLTLSGAAVVNESSWDDGLPLRVDGFDAFGGLYRGDLNFEMYWDDNADKLARFLSILDQGDYIFISSNRQWASIPRVPERYPLTTAYYRALIGCPQQKDIIWCYNVARPGDFDGQLGYELIAVFESFPRLSIPGLGSWEVNDQFAEEAFTVYDHPKVLIFKKSADYDPELAQSILGAVDLSYVVHLTPKQASNYKDLLLPPDRLAAQRAAGTWSQLFDYDWPHNRYPLLGLLVWYLFIFALGLFTYPLLRLALLGLPDRGYPLARAFGLVLLGYFAWLLGSFGAPYTRATIGVVFGWITVAGLGVGWMRRGELRAEWRANRRYFLLVELLFFVFFAFDLLIRLGNPDLWHPAKGGERPMDFSYLNAVLRSTTFPPYDPWFAGGYINYYYYGFVLVGTPIKLLGIVPSIAYNFVLPTLFAIVALGAFSIGWNLLAKNEGSSFRLPPSAFISGLAAALLMVVLGNLGTVRLIFHGLQRLAAPDGIIEDANFVQRWLWAIQGFIKTLSGSDLPFARGDWYWFPSRVIPAPGDVEPITEFPFFTFLYSDLHAHMIALPLALLALSWALGVALGRARWPNGWSAALGFVTGGLVIGALYPTNLSDMYTYLPVGLAALGYALWRYAADYQRGSAGRSQTSTRRLILILLSLSVLTALTFLLYQPYRTWYSQAYSIPDWWKYSRTPIWSYLTHWGVFLFLIVSWMTWETRQWMAATPVSALGKLRRYQLPLEIGLAVFLVALGYLTFLKVSVAWLVLPLEVWGALLLLRPGMPDAKRFVLFLVGTALLITLMVEIVVVRGDIGRMNTVFKFYLQAWTLLAVSAAAAFAWLLPEVPRWLPSWRNAWQAAAVLLLAGAALFTITAAMDKMRDRMATEAPRTLDAMTYMAYARYADQGVDMDLSQDYRAIRWLQDSVYGSPVIAEGNTVEYRWGTRYTIYTGLPGVVGWNWHQRQQRALLPPTIVTDRVDQIGVFYTTTDIETARAFLEKYDVTYIIVAQLERAYYAGDGLLKFEQYDGLYWTEVYRDGETVIYQVLK